MNWIMDQLAAADKAQTLLKQGWSAAGQNDWPRAEARFADALQLGSQLDPTQSDIPVVAMLAMAQISYERGKKEEAIHRATSAFALSAGTGNFSGWQFPLYELMANLFDEMRAPHRAIPFRHVLVRLWRDVEGCESEKAARACAHLAASFEQLGFHEHAARAYGEAVRSSRQYLGQWATSLHLAGRHGEAESAFNNLIEETSRSRGADHAEVAAALAGKGAMYCAWGRQDEAIRCFVEAHRIQLALGATGTPAIAGLMADWAIALGKQGQLGEARRTAEEAVDILRAHDSTRLAIGYESLGRILELQSETQQAEHYCLESLLLMDQHNDTDVARRQSRLEWHAVLLDKLGRAQDAAHARELAEMIARARRQVPDPESLISWSGSPSHD